jgi:hypothetical protein
MDYQQHSKVKNVIHQREWVEHEILFASLGVLENRVLDVGAGLSPYKSHLVMNGFHYVSHDFNSYVPDSKANPGLQDASWIYPKHDYNCDILEIPAEKEFSLVLCTEVLEHVPDPVAALRKMSELCQVNGYIIITCPFLSLMHQAPYWFSSGLSPYWIKHWSREFNLEVIKVEVCGDYVDLMIQEIVRLLTCRFPIRGIFRLVSILHLFRPLIPKQIKDSGGFGTLAVLRKVS